MPGNPNSEPRKFDAAEFVACDLDQQVGTGPLVGNHHIYSPFLWVKGAEQRALDAVKEPHRAVIAPVRMLLPVPKKGRYLGKDAAGKGRNAAPPTYKQHLDQQGQALIDSATDAMGIFGKFERLFVDVSVLQEKEHGRHVLRDLLARLGAHAEDYVPMIDVDPRTSEMTTTKAWHKQHGGGVALRLHYRSGWPKANDVLATLKAIGCKPSDCDLFLDLGAIFGKPTAHYVAPTAAAITAYAGFSFRRIVLCSCAFPPSIGGFPVGRTPVIRKDLVLFCAIIAALTGTTLFYGDHATLAIKPVEGAGPVDLPPTIRYTEQDHWFVYRRRDARELKALCGDIVADFPVVPQKDNTGDRWINEQAVGNRPTSPDLPEKWTHAGLSHHIWFVVKQMNGLP